MWQAFRQIGTFEEIRQDWVRERVLGNMIIQDDFGY